MHDLWLKIILPFAPILWGVQFISVLIPTNLQESRLFCWCEWRSGDPSFLCPRWKKCIHTLLIMPIQSLFFLKFCSFLSICRLEEILFRPIDSGFWCSYMYTMTKVGTDIIQVKKLNSFLLQNKDSDLL